VTLRFLNDVEDQFNRTVVHLENERYGTGLRLATEYAEVLEQLKVNPRFYPRVEDAIANREVRNAAILRATYRVVFEISTEDVLVIGVLHTHRRPGSWHSSLADE